MYKLGSIIGSGVMTPEVGLDVLRFKTPSDLF